ncbi:hypothetical protein Tco_0745998 [Tanacetum coccineum]
MLNPSPDTCIDSIFNLNTESTSLIDVPVTPIAEPPLLSTTTLPPPPTPLITYLQQTPVHTPATIPSSSLQDLPNFGSLFKFEDGVKALEDDFLVFKQTNQFAKVVSSIPGIVDTLRDFLNKLDDNIKKIIKDQVKEQVKAQVSKILPKIKKAVNEQLKAEVLTRSSNESKTSYVVDANLSELELKKILIDKMESNKSIHRSDEQKNLYKPLVDAYKSDKLILDTYGDTVSFKRHRDDEDKDEEPSAGSNWGSKRRRARKEPESTSAPKEKTSKTIGKSTEGSKSHHKSAGESDQAEEPMHTAKDLKEPTHQEFKTGATTDQLDWNNPEGQQYPHDLRKPLPLIPNSRGRHVIPFDHFINNDLEYLSGGVSSRTYTTSVTKTKAAEYGNIKWIEDLVLIQCGVQCRLATTNMLFGESHIRDENDNNSMDLLLTGNLLEMSTPNAKSLLDDDKLYKFKEGDFNRLRIQDIEYMLLLLVQGKLTNLTVEERLAFNNKDKKNRLMRIDELHKFSDGTLNDVQTALDDCLKRIRMKYLPQTIWRQSDRDKAGAMI